jgi:hypothetical protein
MTTKQTEARTAAAERDMTALAAATGRTKLQRSPLVVVIAAVVLCAGLVLGWLLWVATSTAAEVVAAKSEVARGQIITADDLTTVRVTLDPSLRTVPAAELPSLVGKRATTDLVVGTLVSPDQISAELLPPPGMTVVAVPVPMTLLPPVPIGAGDTVRLVQTPGTAGEVTGSPVTVTAEVVSVIDGDPVTVVGVMVPSAGAAQLAELAGTGRIALVLDSAAR